MTYICELAEVHFRPAIGPAVRVYAFSSLYSPVSSRRIHVTFAQTSLSGMQCHSDLRRNFGYSPDVEVIIINSSPGATRKTVVPF